jgi:hypothetical protein
MNIVKLHNNTVPPLFNHMDYSLKEAQVSLAQSIRIAQTIAPLLRDKSSNERHVNVIHSDMPLHKKVIAILMLGFPTNRPMMPLLQNLLYSPTESLAVAASIALAQMADAHNSEIIKDIFNNALNASCSVVVKRAIKKARASLPALSI